LAVPIEMVRVDSHDLRTRLPVLIPPVTNGAELSGADWRLVSGIENKDDRTPAESAQLPTTDLPSRRHWQIDLRRHLTGMDTS
jgi:hypothetical protein